jgi:hypothetical protein
VEPARSREGRLPEAFGQVGDEIAADGGRARVREHVGVHRYLLQRALAAHAARRAREEGPGVGLARERALNVNRVGGQVVGRPGGSRPVDEPFAEQEAERELLVMAGRAHRHGQGTATDAYLERLLDRHFVGEAGRRHLRVRASDSDLGAGHLQRVPDRPGGEARRAQRPSISALRIGMASIRRPAMRMVRWSMSSVFT